MPVAMRAAIIAACIVVIARIVSCEPVSIGSAGRAARVLRCGNEGDESPECTDKHPFHAERAARRRVASTEEDVKKPAHSLRRPDHWCGMAPDHPYAGAAVDVMHDADEQTVNPEVRWLAHRCRRGPPFLFFASDIRLCRRLVRAASARGGGAPAPPGRHARDLRARHRRRRRVRPARHHILIRGCACGERRCR